MLKSVFLFFIFLTQAKLNLYCTTKRKVKYTSYSKGYTFSCVKFFFEKTLQHQDLLEGFGEIFAWFGFHFGGKVKGEPQKKGSSPRIIFTADALVLRLSSAGQIWGCGTHGAAVGAVTGPSFSQFYCVVFNCRVANIMRRVSCYSGVHQLPSCSSPMLPRHLPRLSKTVPQNCSLFTCRLILFAKVFSFLFWAQKTVSIAKKFQIQPDELDPSP